MGEAVPQVFIKTAAEQSFCGGEGVCGVHQDDVEFIFVLENVLDPVPNEYFAAFVPQGAGDFRQMSFTFLDQDQRLVTSS